MYVYIWAGTDAWMDSVAVQSFWETKSSRKSLKASTPTVTSCFRDESQPRFHNEENNLFISHLYGAQVSALYWNWKELDQCLPNIDSFFIFTETVYLILDIIGKKASLKSF